MIGKRERERERDKLKKKEKKKKKRVAIHYSKLLNFLKLSSSNIACILVFVVLKIAFFCGYFNTFNMNAKTTTKKPKSYLYYYESVNKFR